MSVCTITPIVLFSVKKIYKTLWNDTRGDDTRVLDQLFSRLKKKIGANYFETKKVDGIKLK